MDTSLESIRAALRKSIDQKVVGEYDLPGPRHVLSAQWRYSHTEEWNTLGFSATWATEDIEAWARGTVESGDPYGRALVARTIVDVKGQYVVWTIYGDVTVDDFEVKRDV